MTYYLEKIVTNKIEIKKGNSSYVICKPDEILEDKETLEMLEKEKIFVGVLCKMNKTTRNFDFDYNSWSIKKTQGKEITDKNQLIPCRFLLFPEGEKNYNVIVKRI